MADIVINPAVGKIDFFAVKGDNVTNTLKLTGNTLLVTGPLSASSISTGGGGAFVTSVQPTSNFLSKFTGNSTIANSLIYDNATNVGIGTTSPADKLHIIGNVRINGGDILNWSGQAFIQTLGNYDMFFRPNSTLQMILTSNGNLGIGSGFTNPLAKLHVTSATSGDTLLRTDGTNGTLFSVIDDLSDSLMSVNNSAGLPVFEVFADDRIVGGQYGKNDFVVVNNKVGIGTNNPTNKLSVSGSVNIGSTSYNIAAPTNGLIIEGSVGIGTTSPGSKLQVVGTIRSSGTEIFGFGSSDSVSLRAASSANVMGFYTSNAEKMRLDSSGNLGIGTSSPSSKLHLDDANAPWITISRSGTPTWQLRNNYPSNQYGFSFNNTTAGTVPLFIGAGGNIGIGLDSPAAKLDIVGASSGLALSFGTTVPNNPLFINTYGGYAGVGMDQTTAGIRLAGDYSGGTNPLVDIGYYSSGTVAHANWVNRLRVLNNGNIGIGTTAPTAKLHVTGSSSIPAALLMGNVGIGTTSFTYGTTNRGLLEVYGASESLIALRNPTGNLYIQKTSSDVYINNTNSGIMSFATSNAQRMVILAGGSVSFGSASDILGSPGNIYLNGNTGAAAGPVLAFGQSDSVTGGIGHRARIIGSGTSQDIFIQSQGTSNSIGLNANPTGAVIYFQTQGSERVRIDNNGNIGAGTTSPSSLLHLYGANPFVRISNSAASDHGIKISYGNSDTHGLHLLYNPNDAISYIDNTYQIVSGQAYGDIRFRQNVAGTMTTRMTIKSDGGNVGIGTTSPAAKLQVGTSSTGDAGNGDNSANARIGASNAGGIVYNLSLTNTATATVSNEAALSFVLAGNYSATGVISAILRNTTTAASDLLFKNYSAGTMFERMRIQYDGNVGIGTTSPVAKLDINGTSNFGANVYHSIGGQKFFAGSGGTYAYIYTGTTALNFINSNDTSTLMTLLNGGSVGIGTTSPSTKLQVKDAITAGSVDSVSGTTLLLGQYSNGNLTVLGTEYSSGGPVLAYAVSPSTSGAGAFLSSTGIAIPRSAYVQDGGTHRWYVGASQTVSIGSAVSLSETMRINSNGNLGIGTSSPLQILHVNGSILLDGVTNGYTQGATRGIGYGSNSGGVSTDGFSGMDIQSVNAPAPNGGNYSQNLRFWTHHYGTGTGATPRMMIQYNGNVGVGTTSPADKLDVNGNLYFSKAGDPRIYANTGIGLNIDGQALYLNRYTNAAIAMAMGGGNVGIGTTSPSRKLDISGSAIRSFSAGGGGEPGFIVDYPSSNGYGAFFVHVNGSRRWRIGSVGDTNNQPALNFWQEGTGSRMMIINNGNVGIGTTSPGSLLQVGGSAASPTATPTAIQLDNSFRNGVGGNTSLKFYLYKNASESYGFGLNNAGGIEYHAGYSGGGSAYHGFYTDTTEKMRITAVGNVGIGTTAPAYKLDVNGTGRFANDLYTNGSLVIARAGAYLYINGTNSDAEILWQTNGGNRWAMGMNVGDATENLNIYNYTTSTTNFTILKANGNVGIGSTAPAYKLDVNGIIASSGSPIAWFSGNYNRIYEPAGNPALYLGNNSDPNNYYDNNSHVFRSRGGGTNYAFINSSGNLGIGTTSPLTKLDVRGIIQGQSYPVADTGGTGGWVKLGTLTIPQNGYTCHIRAYIHAGFNALNTQDYYVDIFFKTSNASSVDANGFAGNSWYYTTGYTTSDPNPKWVANAAGVSATAYDLYLSLSAFTNRSHYIVEIVEGVTWTNVGSTGQVNPGNGSSTVCVSSVGFNIPLGNVGIGTTAPTNGTLQVYNASGNTLSLQKSGGAAALIMGSDTTNFALLESINAGGIRFYTGNGTQTEKLRIQADGNVGIGGTTPVGRLQLYGSTTSPDLNSTNPVGVALTISNTDYAYGTMFVTYGSGTGALQQRRSAAATFYDFALQPHGGNVGIGTTNPNTTLTVIATNNTGSRIQLGTASNSTYMDANKVNDMMVMTVPYSSNPASVSNGGAKWGIKMNGSVDSPNTKSKSAAIYAVSEENSGTAGGYNRQVGLALHTSGFDLENAERVRINNVGYVGINTNNPTGRLHIVQSNSAGVAAILLSTDESTIQGPSANTQIRMGSNLVLNASGIIPIGTNGSEKMRIQSDGNVGIGTTSPIYKLHVVGNSYVNAGTLLIDSGNSISWGNSTQYIFGNNGVGLTFGAGNATRMFVSSTGNIGIGTTSPLAQLHAVSTTSGATLLRADGTSGTLFSVVDDLTDSLMSVNNSAGLPVFEVFADDRIVGGQYGANDFVVKNNKVGIGTNNPIGKLHVTGSTSTPAAVLLGDVGIGTTAPTAQANYRFLQVNAPTSAVIEAVVAGSRIGGFDSTSNILYVGSIGSFPVVFRTAVDEKMRITANGNIGIGTSSPNSKLTIVGDGTQNNVSGVLRITDTGSSKWGSIGLPDVQTTTSGANNYYLIGRGAALTDRVLSIHIPNAADYGTGAQPKFGVYSTGSDLLASIEANTGTSYFKGNVGIGTSSPTQKLDVAGSIYTSAKLVQKSTTQSLSGTTGCTIDLANGVVHILSLANATTISSFTYNSRDNNPSVNTVILVLKYAGTATITWTNVIWSNGVTPSLTATNGYADVIMLTSYQGGAGTPVWIGSVVAFALTSTNL